MFILDTDTLIYFLKGNEEITKKIASVKQKDLYTTVLNEAELLFGAYHSTKINKNLKNVRGLLSELQILDFSSQAADLFAKEKTRLKKAGALVADMDLMIASICLDKKMTLVSNNAKHFKRLTQLKFENWTKSQ